MKTNFLKKFLIFISILFLILNFSQIIFSVEDSLIINSPNYFGEQNNIYKDIHYLKNEFLSFNFCTNKLSKDISAKITCSNTKKINLNLFNLKTKGCYFSNYDLENLNCSKFSLDLNYKLDNKEKKLKRTFKSQKQSLLINYILNLNYTSLNPLDLSYYLIVLNDVEGINSKKSNDAYQKLKNERNNVDKCWPNLNCNILETTKILKNLKFAEYSLQTRPLEDGLNYLQRNLISNQNNPLKVIINISNSFINNSQIQCNVNIDSNLPQTYLFNSLNTNLLKYISKSISFSCNESVNKIKFNLYNLNNNISKILTYNNSNSFTYALNDFSCIGDLGICDYSASINSLITYRNKITNSNLLENYLDSLISNNGFDITFNTNNEIRDTSKYLYYKNNLNLLDNLKYTQNNDGSWGIGTNYDKIIKTSWAILALQLKNVKNEYVDDGKKWVYFNEPTNGWGSTEKNTLAYLAIKEKIKPYLKINSKNELKNSSKFILTNPTIYTIKNIKLTFDLNINPYLAYVENLGDIGPNEKINFNVSLDKNFVGEKSGNLILTGINSNNLKKEFIKMPVILKGPEPFNLIYKNNISISEENLNISLNVKNNLKFFDASCSYQSPFTQKIENVKITQNTKTFLILNNKLKNGNFSFNIDCNFNDNEFSIPIKFNLDLVQKTFNILNKNALVDSLKDFSIKINNTLNEKQILTFEILGDLNGVIVPTEISKIIAPKDTREIFFSIKDKQYLTTINNSNSQILITSNKGYSKKIPISLDLNSINLNSSTSIWLYLLYGFLTIFIIFIIIRTIQYYKQKNSNFDKNSNEEEIYFDEEFK